jgi:hypothetical protein
MRLVPIYTNPDITNFHRRFGFQPFEPGVGPCAWAWVHDEARLIWSEAYRCELILEPGKLAPCFAHELFWAEWERELSLDAAET